MTIPGLAARNLLRNKFRTVLTLSGVAIAILAFILIQTVIASWKIGVTTAAKDRIVSRHKVTFVLSLPKKYIENVRAVEGVKEATWSTWFGGKNPADENTFFMTVGVEPETYFDVYDEVGITPAEKAAFLEDRQGAVIGDVLAKKFNWKVGDTVQIVSGIYPGEWPFHVKAIYKPLRKSAARDMFIFDWDYLNEQGPARAKEQIGWITSRVEPGVSAADLSLAIDRVFDEKDVQTLSQDEGAFQASFLGMMTTILGAMNIVSIVILLIMMLILGNTVAMGVRERTREYGVLRAVGFLPGHLATLVIGEAAVLGLVGGLAGLLLAVPVVGGMGKFLEENMSAFFPVFQLGAVTAGIAVVVAILLGTVSAAIPAWQTSRLKVVDALRSVA